ncbi:hypothetical protein ES703_71931 [subsurface metagenome]
MERLKQRLDNFGFDGIYRLHMSSAPLIASSRSSHYFLLVFPGQIYASNIGLFLLRMRLPVVFSQHQSYLLS